jgi:UDP-2,3-diacylglucosamine pyrophosphatase LpxH
VVDLLSPALGDHTHDEATLTQAAERQKAWAEAFMTKEPSIDLVIMSHTHRATIADLENGRQYLNPGAWFDGFRYAIATESGAELRKFEPAGS